ncbi:MAG: enoyl-CoA hydratase/isomerase family protein [bacterium]|nr:enoyl-CoA hydratase [Deltaproteobacteria bacterium]MCP4903717.1 enoyl-CoA hydratase/isomerase family protein [bacterium]
MTDALTLVEEMDGLAILTLNRPDKRNALSLALRHEIMARLDELQKSESIRAVVMTGAGSSFCAGFDRAELLGGAMEEVFVEANEYHRRVFTFGKPLIAAVNGPALGGGCDLAAMCDFRIAGAAAIFGQPQVHFGAAASYDLMRAVVGTGPAREMCLTGRNYDAHEALAIGLANRVVDSGELLATTTTLAGSIAALPAGVAEGAKRGFVEHQPPVFGA